MGFGNDIRNFLSGLVSRKDVRRAIAESGTQTVYFPSRFHPLGKKYIYGKSPELYEAQLHQALPPPPELKYERPGPIPCTDNIPRDDRTDIEEYADALVGASSYAFVRDKPDGFWIHDARIGEWLRGKLGGNDVWKLCRLLENPRRLKLLILLYKACPDASRDALDVSTATCGMNIDQSITSRLLQDLCAIGLLRRTRSGNRTLYSPLTDGASPEVAELASMFRRRVLDGSYDTSYSAVFSPMMNAFRARIIHYVACGGDGRTEALAELLCKKPRFVIRDLEYAVSGGLLDMTSEDGEGRYIYYPPKDPIGQRIVELAR